MRMPRFLRKRKSTTKTPEDVKQAIANRAGLVPWEQAIRQACAEAIDLLPDVIAQEHECLRKLARIYCDDMECSEDEAYVLQVNAGGAAYGWMVSKVMKFGEWACTDTIRLCRSFEFPWKMGTVVYDDGEVEEDVEPDPESGFLWSKCTHDIFAESDSASPIICRAMQIMGVRKDLWPEAWRRCGEFCPCRLKQRLKIHLKP